MTSVLSLWRSTKQMPVLFRMFCQGGMLALPILAILLSLPVTNWTVNGRSVTYEELWQSGAGLTMLAFMLVGAAGAWGSAARAAWARWAWVATPVVPLLVAAAQPRTWFTDAAVANGSVWLSAFATSALIAAGLFLVPSVRAYFGAHHAADA
jgi:hypothetical protein